MLIFLWFNLSNEQRDATLILLNITTWYWCTQVYNIQADMSHHLNTFSWLQLTSVMPRSITNTNYLLFNQRFIFILSMSCFWCSIESKRKSTYFNIKLYKTITIESLKFEKHLILSTVSVISPAWNALVNKVLHWFSINVHWVGL